MRKHLAILATAAFCAVIAGPALAQTCTPNAAQKCLTRFSDPNDFISRLAPGYGGPVVCDAVAAGKVQYDLYVWINSFIYTCSMDQTCAWAQTNDPQAYSMFCP